MRQPYLWKNLKRKGFEKKISSTPNYDQDLVKTPLKSHIETLPHLGSKSDVC
jgi:hypothetical protein